MNRTRKRFHSDCRWYHCSAWTGHWTSHSQLHHSARSDDDSTSSKSCGCGILLPEVREVVVGASEAVVVEKDDEDDVEDACDACDGGAMGAEEEEEAAEDDAGAVEVDALRWSRRNSRNSN